MLSPEAEWKWFSRSKEEHSDKPLRVTTLETAGEEWLNRPQPSKPGDRLVSEPFPLLSTTANRRSGEPAVTEGGKDRAAGFVDRFTEAVLRIDLQRVLDLFQFLLDSKTREKVFEPSKQELLEEFYACRKYRTRGARRWLAFSFSVRIACLFLACVRNMTGTAMVNLLLLFVPAHAREAFRRIFRIK